MRVNYDPEADVITIVFNDGRIKESDEVRPGLIVDFGYDENILRVEILDASKQVDNAREMQFAVNEIVNA